MIWLSLLLLQAVAAPEVLERGAVVFAQSCATGYLHSIRTSVNEPPIVQERDVKNTVPAGPQGSTSRRLRAGDRP